MGEYARLYIDGYEVDSWKNSIGEGSYIFAEEDGVQTPRPYYGDDEDEEETDSEQETFEDNDEGDDSWRGYSYRNTAQNIIDRLDIMGFTLDRAREWFEQGIKEEIERAKKYRDMIEPGDNYDIPLKDPFNPFHPEAIKNLEGYTFEVWSNLIRDVFEGELEQIPFNEETDLQTQNPYLYHILERSNDSRFGFPGYSGMHMYRAILEIVPPDAPVILDFSSLWGYVDPEQYICNPPSMVIMTEGSSDKRILDGTLGLLYPHLKPYYSFIDFDLANMPGSTGHLLNIVKAFVATGVQHRTIAVFDNDSAGHDALRQLANVPLPDSIKAIALPHLPLATHYPTIGPQGHIETDINGLACSLELYLGRDVLEDDTGKLTPVQWGGMMQGVRRYQGEILNKTAIQNKYLRLLSDVSSKPELMHTHDWSGMRSVFQSIFDLFKNQPVFQYDLR